MTSSLVEDVGSIMVLRPNAVGDFVFALPALHALRHAYPRARIVYLGRQWHADFLRDRPGPIDEVKVMPPCPGIGASPDGDAAPARSFVDELRRERPDIVLQLYGGGRYSNPFILGLGARVSAGMKADDAPPLQRWVSYGPLQNRRLQLLEVAALVGADMVRLGRELETTVRDRQEAARIVPLDHAKPLVLIHPSASDPRRRWAAVCFAQVADRLAQAGATVVVNATQAEAPLARAVSDQMRCPAFDLSGRLSLGGLCGLLERCVLVISNDSGPLHLALALGVRGVGIYWLHNLYESAPLTQDRHRAALSCRIHCPVCGAENLQSRCQHDVSFVDDVSVDEVITLALALFASGR